MQLRVREAWAARYDDGAADSRGVRRRRFVTAVAAAVLLCGVSVGGALPAASLARGGAGGGGVKPPPPKLPADLPPSFPIPPLKLVASSGASPNWTVGMFDAADVGTHQRVVDFYRAHGFTWDVTPFDDSTLHNAKFTVVVVTRTADTSSGVGAGTDMVLGITAR